LLVQIDDSNLSINTLSLNDISVFNYEIPPNIGSSDKLFIGSKSDFNIPYSLIKIDTIGQFSPSTGIKWSAFLDSSVTLNRIDSIHFRLFSNDSSLNDSSDLKLYLNLNMNFSEDSSTYLNTDGNLLSDDWNLVGTPSILSNNDTLGGFINTELRWSLKPFDSLLIWDQNDSLNLNISRVFAIVYENDTSSIELLSRESSTGATDPKIDIYYRQNVILNADSTLSDTSLSATFYAIEDVSIINPTSFIQENWSSDTSFICINNGSGLQSVVHIPFDSSFLPTGSIIRNAILKITIDSTRTDSGQQLVFNPISEESSESNEDPYSGLGAPYRVSSKTDGSSVFKISLKTFFQDIIYNKQSNMGFKVISNISNSPFKSVFFNLRGIENEPTVEITYVKM
jgi:hypothetical protein